MTVSTPGLDIQTPSRTLHAMLALLSTMWFSSSLQLRMGVASV
jgi:hypothetical protein